MHGHLTRGLVVSVAAIVATSAATNEVTLEPAKDNTLYEQIFGAFSNGAGDNFFAGKSAIGELRRGLVAFDVASSIPPGALVDSVALTLHLSRTNPIAGGPETVSLHRLLSDWGEAGSDAFGGEGGGTSAEIGDATWLHTHFDTDFWATVGGDYSATVSASAVVDSFHVLDPLNFYSWSAPQLTADVQSMVDDPKNDFGWAVIGNEVDLFTAKRFDTKEDSVAAYHPRLFVEFTLDPTSAPELVESKHPLLSVTNPFRPGDLVRYRLPRSGTVTLGVYDVRGALVSRLAAAVRAAGEHSTPWNASAQDGSMVPAGVYFVRLTLSDREATRKFVLSR